MEVLDPMVTLAANGTLPNEYRTIMKIFLHGLRNCGNTGSKEQIIESAYGKNLVTAL